MELNNLDPDVPLMQHQESRDSYGRVPNSRDGSRGGSGSGKRVDLSNVDDNIVLEPKGKPCFNSRMTLIKTLSDSSLFTVSSEHVDHQDYMPNIGERPKTAVRKGPNMAAQFDDDAADLLPD